MKSGQPRPLQRKEYSHFMRQYSRPNLSRIDTLKLNPSHPAQHKYIDTWPFSASVVPPGSRRKNHSCPLHENVGDSIACSFSVERSPNAWKRTLKDFQLSP